MILEISTDEGGILIREDELSSITDAELQRLRISREDLHRCFAEGAAKLMQGKLMQGMKPGDRVRPCADETRDGKWVVSLGYYSPDPPIL